MSDQLQHTGQANHAEELARFIAPFHPPGGSRVFEVRVLKIRDGRRKPYNAAGYFTDPVAAAKAVLPYELKHSEGIYITLNPPNPLCHARAPDRIDDYLETTTSDGDILRREWLVIDCDPKRPKGVCATAEMVEAASAFAGRVRMLLAERFGWPDPAEAMSGNGQYLLYRVEQPNDGNAKNLLEGVLKGLNVLMTEEPGGGNGSDAAVRVDETMFNAARIIRLIGTVNKKGHSTERQPHRPSQLLHLPEKVEVVSAEKLAAVAAFGPKGKAAKAPGGPHERNGHATAHSAGGGHRLKVEEWLGDRNVSYQKKAAPNEGRTVYVLAECPFDSSHRAPDSCIMQGADGAMSAKCFHDSCSGKGWQEFKTAIGPPESHHYDPPLRPKGEQRVAATPPRGKSAMGRTPTRTAAPNRSASRFG